MTDRRLRVLLRGARVGEVMRSQFRYWTIFAVKEISGSSERRVARVQNTWGSHGRFVEEPQINQTINFVFESRSVQLTISLSI